MPLPWCAWQRATRRAVGQRFVAGGGVLALAACALALLRQLAHGVVVAALMAEEAKHRLPIRLAERAERGLRLGRLSPGAQNERPARRGKAFSGSLGGSKLHES
jgi:hypothetical protein